MTEKEAIRFLDINREHLKNTNSIGLKDDIEALDLAIKALEQEPIEVEATKLQMAYNQGFEDCRKAVMDLLNEAGKFSLLAMVADLASINPQEPKTGHWRPIYQGDEIINYRCSECEFGNTFGKSTYRMNYCPNCGARMAESEVTE